MADDISKALEIADEGDSIVFEKFEKEFLILTLQELKNSLKEEKK